MAINIRPTYSPTSPIIIIITPQSRSITAIRLVHPVSIASFQISLCRIRKMPIRTPTTETPPPTSVAIRSGFTEKAVKALELYEKVMEQHPEAEPLLAETFRRWKQLAETAVVAANW